MKKKKIIQISIILGVIIIPLLYSCLYLGAFWDPYSSLDKLPVAVVNNDKGAVIKNENRNLGQEFCDKLKEENSLKFIFTDEDTAKKGTEGNTYYAMIVIPENFSKNIASSGTASKVTAEITFSSNEKRNFLASQILSKAVVEMEESLRSKVNKEITAELSDKLRAVPNQLNDLKSGLNQLNNGLSDFKGGISNAADSTNILSSGANNLNSGISHLLDGVTQLENSTQNLPKLQQGAAALSENLNIFNSGLITYTQGVDILIQNISDMSLFLTNYVTANPSLMSDPAFAAFINNISSPNFQNNIQTLSAASANLKASSDAIAKGAAQLSDSTADLVQFQSAVSTIKNGLEQAKTGSGQLASGSAALASGMGSLNHAAGQLQNGLNAIQGSVSASAEDASDQVKNLNGLDEYAENSVTIDNDSINPVPNYGTAFAPYFLSLSLWVGALIIFVGTYLDSDEKFKILSQHSNNKIIRTLLFLLLAFTQAVALAIIVKLCLGLHVNHPVLYFLSCGLVSMVFLSIVQFLMVFLKDIGKFLSLLLLIVQLTSCGGTFPMETVPSIFNKLYPFMPMTYSVNLFKEAISGGDMHAVMTNVGILFAILAVFTVLTIIMSKTKKNVNSDKMNVKELPV